ncbi:MAG: GNAT family N-acetyltransferase [Acidobacteria bacterium]|nr:GNAT family N-acetyltransferase [Acidobacteriota bacterium]
MDWRERYADKVVPADRALAGVRSGSHVFVGSGGAEPQRLVRALVDRAPDLSDTEVLHVLTLGDAPYSEPRYQDHFRHNAFFIGQNVRDAVLEGYADYTPMFLSEIPDLFRSGRVPVDIALIQVSPPDANGFCSLGISVDVVKAAAESARTVVAEVNPRMPRTHGDSFLHVDRISFLVENDAPLLELPRPEPDETARRIGRNVAGLIDPGSTLQVGIGKIPDALVQELRGHADLGVHTEMFSDGLLELIEAGAVTNRRKTLHPGKVILSFCMGSRRLYEFVDDNPLFEFHPSDYVNDPLVIARNDRMVAVNSALQIDITGQVAADSMGYRFYSGFGGQVDFIRGAARSRGGKPIIAIPATAKGATVSRIVPVLSEGAGVVTTRADVHYVVTEYGIASLHGRTIRERALALIHVAHPDFRSELLAAARERRYVTADQIPLPAGGRPYPAELEKRVTLRQGFQVLFRPIRPADERELRDLFYSHSEETIYQRYGLHLKRLTQEQVQRFCTVDYDAQMAIVGFVEEGGREKMIAVGRYYLDRTTSLAEVAFTVHDDYQNRGVGRFLLEYLRSIARGRGIQGFTARVLADNTRMLHLFHKCCSPIESRLEGSGYRITCRFARAAADPVPAAAAP